GIPSQRPGAGASAPRAPTKIRRWVLTGSSTWDYFPNNAFDGDWQASVPGMAPRGAPPENGESRQTPRRRTMTTRRFLTKVATLAFAALIAGPLAVPAEAQLPPPPGSARECYRECRALSGQCLRACNAAFAD